MKEVKAMKRNLLLCIGVVFVLSACTIKGPEVEVRPPEVIVDPPVQVETDDHSHSHRHPGPRHCPPGHAKKGWC
jgi:hypothetical protein